MGKNKKIKGNIKIEAAFFFFFFILLYSIFYFWIVEKNQHAHLGLFDFVPNLPFSIGFLSQFSSATTKLEDLIVTIN